MIHYDHVHACSVLVDVCTILCLLPGSFVASSRKEEDCVLLQCREKNQLCMAR